MTWNCTTATASPCTCTSTDARYVYANFAGTLNAPADLATHYMPPTRHAMHEMARQGT